MTLLRRTRGVVLLGAGLSLVLILLVAGELRLGLRWMPALIGLVPVAVGLVLGGPLAAGTTAAVAVGSVAVGAGGSAAIVLALRYVVPGLALGVVLGRRLHLSTSLMVVAAAALLGLLLLVWGYVPAGTGVLAFLAGQIEGQVSELDRLSGLLGTGRDPTWVADSTRLVAAALRVAGPAVFAVGLLALALTNYVGARLCLRGRGFRAFAEEAVPDHLVWGVIVAGAMAVSQHAAVERVGLNLLIVLAVLYAIQGFAVLRHFFQKARVPRPLQGVSFGLIALQPLLLVAAACLGLSDLWVDFRKIRRAPTPA